MSPWKLLGLQEGAGVAEVKAAYRRACLLLHPDRFAGAPEALVEAATRAMQDAVVAYEVLMAAARSWEPAPEGSTAMAPYRPRNRWDRALAAEAARGHLADVAA